MITNLWSLFWAFVNSVLSISMRINGTLVVEEGFKLC